MPVIRVLYVDDEPGLLELGRIFLEQDRQFSVDTVPSAVAALDLLGQHPYDAIVSDYQMPEMDGIEFLKRVRGSENSIPFILFTGRGREEIVIQALNEGADFYLQKGGNATPQFAELAHKIQKAVLQKRAENAVILRESYLTAIIENQPGLVWLKDPDGRFLAANEAFARSCGKRSAADVLGLTDLDIWPEDLARKYRADDARVIATGQPLHVEEKIADKNQVKWFETYKMPIKNAAGTVIGTTGFARDITLRRSADEMLATIRELEQEFASLPSAGSVEERAAKKLLAISGAVATTFNIYDRQKQVLRAAAIEIAPGVLKSLPDAWQRLTGIIGMDPVEIAVPVTPAMYQDINRSYITTKRSIAEMSNGQISPSVSAGIQALAAIDRFLLITHVIDGELYGTSLLALRADQPDPPPDLLDSFAHMVAVSLRRQQAEAALRESDERLREIAENITTVFYISDRAMNRFTYVSPAYEIIWGRSARSLLDDPFSFLAAVLPEDLPAVQEAIRKELDEGIPVDTEYRIRHTDGTVRWIHSRNFPIRDTTGRIYRVAGLAEDITELKNSQSALVESEEKFRSLVEYALESISILDFSGRCLFANKATARLLEMPEETNLTGKDVMEFLAPASREKAAADFARVSGGHDAYLAYYSVITAQGNSRTVESIGKVISYEGRHAILLSLHDITGLRSAEERLRAANRQLTLLTSITRHDILNKVSVTRGFLQLAKKNNSDPAVNSLLDRIDTETNAIRSQIEFTRVYQDLGSHEPQWLALADVVPRSSIPPTIAFSVEGNGYRIFADPMLKTVFGNLLDNSVRHGDRVTEIRVCAFPSGKDLMVVWEDNGIGISAGEKEHIFDRGYGKNTGLGMFLAREILSLTGITILENGEPGKGARFEMTVPSGAFRSDAGTPAGN
ncbi:MULTISPECIES: PAS domain S-box protein [unclassified Methanoregula]|uniref:response regulator n=1 Tax=unclassified Methanoregula TaxID=2649730 RepID=UPI0009CDC72B|nr:MULTISPECIES: PAS domain S-box protein [unclassified Methanoregula]OPX65380.1 MAG: aerobic respiration control sensor protein ArcB [Methanoregula sp. PtaB.Bin085]OPY32289.1 MAG: aerobic respiration control sensor protein ArcB [Methanoregula sp. PtaU1.Bin006]